MTAPKMTITLDDAGLREKIKVYLEVFNKKRLLKAIGLRHLSWVTTNFENEGAAFGGWQVLRPNTVAGRRMGSSKILQDTGNLKNSFIPGGGGNVLDVAEADSSVRVGTRNQIAQFHEFGTKPYPIEPKGDHPLKFMTVNGIRAAWIVHHPGLPIRQMLPNENTARQLAVSIIDADLARAKEQAGG